MNNTNKTLLFANMYLGKGSIISVHLNKPLHINKKLRFSTPRRWSNYYFMPLLYAESGEANDNNNFNQYFSPKWFFFLLGFDPTFRLCQPSKDPIKPEGQHLGRNCQNLRCYADKSWKTP